MTRYTRFAVALSLALVSAAPTLSAARRRRAVTPPASASTAISGTVRDAASNAPVIGAIVAAGREKIETDSQGKFTIEPANGGSVTLAVSRSGYETKQVAATTGASNLEIRLNSLPTTSLRLTNGQTMTLDTDSLTFAYLVPLSGYAGSDTMNLCRDGLDWHPTRADVKRLVGPGVMASGGSCCTLGQGQAMSITVELKTGDRATAYFKDSCQGYEVDIKARNHVSGEWMYLRYTDIAEVVFP